MRTSTLSNSFLRAALALLTLCLALSACSDAPEGDWHELAVNEGGFSVLMRGQAHYARQPVDTPAGRMVGHLYSSDRPDAYYAVGYSDFPLTHVLGRPAEEVLSGVRETWVKRIDGRIVESKAIEIDGKHPGTAFVAEGKVKGADTRLEARLYLVDQRLYQLVALTRKGEVPQRTVKRYLDSFKLIPGSPETIYLAPEK